MRIFEKVNRHLLFSISHELAILPYLLRSLRIKRMFQLREQYCSDGKLPRKSIERWSENRVIIFLFIYLALRGITDIILREAAFFRHTKYLYSI